jgi:hypothetical protein
MTTLQVLGDDGRLYSITPQGETPPEVRAGEPTAKPKPDPKGPKPSSPRPESEPKPIQDPPSETETDPGQKAAPRNIASLRAR